MKRIRYFKNYNKFTITIILLIICFIISSILLVNASNQFSVSVQNIGAEIPQKIKDTQEAYIKKNDAILKAIAHEITEMREEGINPVSIDEINKMYYDYGKILEVDNIKMYAIIDGKFYSTDDVKYVDDYTKTEWYEKVMEAPAGKIIYTNARYYNGTDEKVITSAIKIENSNDILAINIFPERITTWPDIEIFPKGTCYYITDGSGKIIHEDNSDPDIEPDATKEYLINVYPELDTYTNEITSEEDAVFVATNADKKAVVYTIGTYNGWQIVVMIPYREMLSGTISILIAYYITTVIFALLILYLVLSEKKALDEKNLYNRISKAFSDSYYAIYLVDFEKGQYKIIKQLESMQDIIPNFGDYDVFMNYIETIMEKEAYKEFKETFSIDNIHRLVKNNVRSFGGDFKRAFNSEIKWVNVQMLYSKENVRKTEVIFAFQDVDSRKEKELQEKEVLLESIQTMQLSTQSKNRFFANMSHDMRTPLNAIINLSNMSIDNIENKEKVLDYLKKINISSTQLLELINNILDVSKIEENMPLINKVEFNILESIKETLSIFEEQAQIQRKNLKIVCNIKHEYVLSDWGKIRQIINNVMSNAFKYTKQNANISIEINEIEGKFISKYDFKITDNGIGMSKEFLDKIYTPFERETRFHSKEMSGTGLGMSIVQSNIQKLNGQIEIKSKPGKGSEVHIVLPIETVENTEHSTKEQEPESLQDLKDKKILLVEDNELNMEISTEILEMQGVKITQALDGKQALDIFANSEENYFDAILMDIQMPIMDGYEATRAIRKLPRKDAKTMPILAVTANAFAEDIIEAEKAGMNDHISKPIDFKELQKSLTKHMKKR